MRALLLLALAACQTASQSTLDGVGGGGGGGTGGNGGGITAECAIDADCALAAAKCCDCPTFAVPLADPAHAACETVSCPMNNTCPANTRAACDSGQCVLQCAPLACTLACANGYKIDPTGCLECACAEAQQAPQCTSDNDCVRTRADCCGCTLGGKDTAVAAIDQATYDASLGCPADPSCPGGDTCVAGTQPRCIEGSCELAMPTPANACTGSCPSGQSCVINADAGATMQGVGVCM